MSSSRKLVIVAVDGKEQSKPISVNIMNEYDDPVKGTFVLRLDPALNRDGDEVINLSNSNFGIIRSHSPEYLDIVLKGFRRKQGDNVFIVAKMFVDNLPSASSLATSEKF